MGDSSQPQLVPVSGDPFGAQPSTLMPVDHDPFASLGPLGKDGKPVAPQSAAPYKPTAADIISAAGPLGDAGMQIGDALRTGNFDARDIAPIAAGTMLGIAAPAEEEGAGLGARALSEALDWAGDAAKAAGKRQQPQNIRKVSP